MVFTFYNELVKRDKKYVRLWIEKGLFKRAKNILTNTMSTAL